MAQHALVASQAPHPGWLNGGTAANARQYFLRPSQHTPNGPRIASAIAGMAAGEFRTVWADVSGDLFRVRRADDGSLAAILDWNPHKVWHAATEQFLLGGRRGTIKLTAYSDITGQWRELPMPAALARNISGTVHWYGNISQDGAGNVYYGTTEAVSQTWRFNPVNEAWTRLADTPSYSQLGSVMEWFPDANGGAGGLVKCLPLGTGTGRLILLNAAETAWSVLASGFGNGQHALVRYHPSHGRLLIVGGTSSVRAATLMTAAGVTTALTNVPDDVVMSLGSWVVAHPSGCWLVRTVGASETLYAAWPNAGYTDVTWEDLGTAPDSATTNATAVWDGDRERVFITAETGLFAWRPMALAGPSDATAPGTTQTVVVSLLAGAASGAASGTAPAATLTATVSLLPGQAAGQGEAAGVNLTTTVSLIPGSASAGTGAAAPGALLSVAATLIPGAASAGAPGAALGALLQATATLISGTAFGVRSETALGVVLPAIVAFLPGAAYEVGPATQPSPADRARGDVVPQVIQGGLVTPGVYVVSAGPRVGVAIQTQRIQAEKFS